MYVGIAIVISVNIMKPDSSAVPFFLDSHNLIKPSTSSQAIRGEKKNNPENNDCRNSLSGVVSTFPIKRIMRLSKSTQHNMALIVATILFLQIKNEVTT